MTPEDQRKCLKCPPRASKKSVGRLNSDCLTRWKTLDIVRIISIQVLDLNEFCSINSRHQMPQEYLRD